MPQLTDNYAAALGEIPSEAVQLKGAYLKKIVVSTVRAPGGRSILRSPASLQHRRQQRRLARKSQNKQSCDHVVAGLFLLSNPVVLEFYPGQSRPSSLIRGLARAEVLAFATL